MQAFGTNEFFFITGMILVELCRELHRHDHLRPARRFVRLDATKTALILIASFPCVARIAQGECCMRLFVSLFALIFVCAVSEIASAQSVTPTPQERVRIDRILRATPLIDGHNDLPWEIRERYDSDFSRLDLNSDLSRETPPKPAGAPFLMTDIPRLRHGGLGGQFWSVYVPAELPGATAAEMVHEQIDLVRRMIARYPNVFELATDRR